MQPEIDVRLYGPFEHRLSEGTLLEKLERFKGSADGFRMEWRRGGDYVETVLRAHEIKLPLEGDSFAGGVHEVLVFPHPEERLRFGAEFQKEEGLPKHTPESMYKGGELAPLDDVKPGHGVNFPPGALAKIDVLPCVFEDGPALLIQYPQVSNSYWKLSNQMRRRYKRWQTQLLSTVETIARFTGFKAVVAMSDQQIREDNAYAGGFISDDIVRQNFTAPYERTGYGKEDVMLRIPSCEGDRILEGSYWVKRLHT